MPNPVQVEVVLSNSESLPVVDVWLVIDVLRASTVIVNWFAAGGGELYPTDSVASARLLAERLTQEGKVEKAPILMGEQDAVAPPGFDLGNSPLEITETLVQETPCAVMATTNGTVAMLKAASTGVPVLIACARNALAALSLALSKGRRIGILCSGRKGRPAWDDTLCAGLLISHLVERFSDIHLSDSARLALLTWRNSADFKASLRSAEHAIFLEKIGFGDDITFVGEINAARVVPELCEYPDGDDMRAVLKPAKLDEQTLLTDRTESEILPTHTAKSEPLSLGVERHDGYPVVALVTRQNEELSRHLLSIGVKNAFFTGAKYKPRKTKTARYDRH